MPVAQTEPGDTLTLTTPTMPAQEWLRPRTVCWVFSRQAHVGRHMPQIASAPKRGPAEKKNEEDEDDEDDEQPPGKRCSNRPTAAKRSTSTEEGYLWCL